MRKFTSWFHLIDMVTATGHITPPKERPAEPCSVLTPPQSPRGRAPPAEEHESLTPRLMAEAAVCLRTCVPYACGGLEGDVIRFPGKDVAR